MTAADLTGRTKLKIDLHMHSTASDGTDTPEELLGLVRGAGITVFSVTDHDSVNACAAIRRILTQDGPEFLNGAEFSCRDGKGKYHILGYRIDPEARSILNVLAKGHQLRMRKVTARLEFLKDRFEFEFPDAEIGGLLALDNPGKPHIANMMVRHGYAENKEQAIREFIDKIGFPDDYVRPEEAIEGILGAGGIPVLAHPSYGDGDQLIIGDEMDERLKRLMGFGLRGVEAFYSGFTARLRGEMLSFAERYGLYVTAGSDYHGSNKLVVLGDTGLEDDTELPREMVKFLENTGILV